MSAALEIGTQLVTLFNQGKADSASKICTEPTS